MIWTYLRSCYSFYMRLYIGGRETVVPARWLFCAPGAKYFPSPHGGEASVWLQNFEVNREWGEVTPWPQDPIPPTTWRILDRGINPGYAGLCYVGERQWFNDGRLPADILSRPVTPFPECCFPTPAVSGGGIVIGGTALARGGPGYVARGGLALGGRAAARGATGYASQGGLALGGAAVAGYRWASAGGLALGGTGTGSARGYGTDCESAYTLTLDVGALPQSFAVAVYWYRVYLTAGQTYHVTATQLSGMPTPLYWNLRSGVCGSQVQQLNDGYACLPYVAPFSAYYYLEVIVSLAGSGQWQIGVYTGPCP